MTEENNADKQRENSAAKAKPRGKAFEKGNPYVWTPGKSGNPKGRPKGKTISDSLRQLLSENHVEEHSVADAVAEKLVEKALDGNIEAIKEVADRTEGKATQRTEISGSLSLESLTPEQRRARIDELERKRTERTGGAGISDAAGTGTSGPGEEEVP